MIRGCFVAGTDTGVGKTHVAAAIARALREAGEDVSAYKPVVSGIDNPGPRDHELLAQITGQDPAEISPIAYGPAVSPHLGAELAGEMIDIDDLVARGKALPGTVVVEGIGGLLVPVTDTFSVRDFAVAFDLPVVIAARPALGTINHTLLTLESARSAGLEVRAVIITPWPEEPSTMELSNRDTIARLGDVAVHTLGETEFGAATDLPVAEWVG
jgi:dethiobiotin synthetase